MTGESYIHEIDDVLMAAKLYGFELRGKVRERQVTEEDIKTLGERGKKWVGIKCWFGCVLQLAVPLGQEERTFPCLP